MRELIDVRDPNRADQLIQNAIDQVKLQKHWGLAPHAPYTASRNLYRRCEEIAAREDVLLTTHLAESREETSMFRDASGSLYDFLKEIGRDMSDCGGRTSLELFSNQGDCLQFPTDGSVNRPYLFVHLNELSDQDLSLMKKSARRDSIVHCPRSHEYFEHSPFQFEKLHALGFNICLGTDSLASNDDLSLFAEMRAFQKEFPAVRPEEILEMVTINSARALGQGKALGKIQRDFLADFIAVPITAI